MTRSSFHNAEGASPRAAPQRDGAQAIHRAIGLLRNAAASRGGASLSSLCASSGLAMSTVHRTLAALVEEGMLVKDARTRRYRPGPLLHELGLAAPPPVDLRAIAHPVLERLAEATGDTAYLNVRSGTDALCLDVCVGRCPNKALPMSVGNRRPLGVGAAALAVLGALPAAEAALVMQHNADRYRRPGLTPDKVAAALRELQSYGHIVTTGRLGGHYRGVAVPVTDRQGRFALALSISAMAERLDAARISQVVVALRREAREFAQAL